MATLGSPVQRGSNHLWDVLRGFIVVTAKCANRRGCGWPPSFPPEGCNHLLGLPLQTVSLCYQGTMACLPPNNLWYILIFQKGDRCRVTTLTQSFHFLAGSQSAQHFWFRLKYPINRWLDSHHDASTQRDPAVRLNQAQLLLQHNTTWRDLAKLQCGLIEYIATEHFLVDHFTMWTPWQNIGELLPW